MKKLIFRAPVITASGYGVHSRMLLKSLHDTGKFDITVMSVPWGKTSLVYDEGGFYDTIRELSNKFDPQKMSAKDFDVSVQVTIPNEFMPLAKRNIGVTAGIETTRVSPVWHQKSNEMDLVVVPSNHSLRTFTNAIYNLPDGQQLLLRKPIWVLPEWVDKSVFNTDPVQHDPTLLKDMPDFNFVVVGLGMDKNDGEDRKNITNTVKWFCEQFRGSKDVGLVLKVSMVNGSPVDFRHVKARIEMIKRATGCGQYPRIHLIHGRLGDGELAALYKHPKIKAMVSLTHGEGFGLPLVEAAACGLPIIATGWSGQLDFLQVNGVNKYVPVEYQLGRIPPSAVWKDVLEDGTQWANPLENDAKLKMAKVVISYDKPKQWAVELAKHVADNFNEDLGRRWAEDVVAIAEGAEISPYKHYHVQTKPSEQKLEDVTIVAVGTNNPQAALHAIQESRKQIGFAHAILVVDELYDGPNPGADIVVLKRHIDSVAKYDEFIMRDLPDYVKTSHFLTVQWDGYVTNGSAWNDEFLKYDYIGAPWFWNNVVGNSGFHLRSLKLARELQSVVEYPNAHPMDTQVCENYRKKLEGKGFKFAPAELARTFSVENEPYTGQFGWHGINPFVGSRP